MKKPAWSHSSLKDFEGCQRRYHEVKVLKKYPFQETEATRYGNQVHKAIEDYIRDKKPIPPEYAQFQPVVDAMLGKPGRALAEYEMALTVDLRPTSSMTRTLQRGLGIGRQATTSTPTGISLC